MLTAVCRARSRVRGKRIAGIFLSAIEHVEPLRGSTPPAIKRCGLHPLNTCAKCETFQRFHGLWVTGSTGEEARKELLEALEGWITVHTRDGKNPLPETPQVRCL